MFLGVQVIKFILPAVSSFCIFCIGITILGVQIFPVSPSGVLSGKWCQDFAA